MKSLSIVAIVLSLIACTWVWYSHYQIAKIKNLPVIQESVTKSKPFQAIFVSDEANFWKTVEQIKTKIFKTMKYKVVNSESAKWMALIKKFDAKYLPLMVTWPAIKTSEIKDYLSQLAVEKDWEFSVNIWDMGWQIQVDISKSYLKIPKILAHDPVKWPKDAKVTLIEISDFECPYCEKLYNNAYKKITAKYWNEIKFVFKHLPLWFHKNAQKAAEASQCANKEWKFWEMHDKLFENQKELSVKNYKKWAWEMWLNKTAFNKCLDSWETEAEVKANAAQAGSFWIQWTPWVFINNKFVNWAYPFETFEKLIEAELAK